MRIMTRYVWDGVWVEVYSDYLLSNKPRSTPTLRTAYDIPLPSQAETLVILEVRECSDQCVSDRVTDFLGGLGLS